MSCLSGVDRDWETLCDISAPVRSLASGLDGSLGPRAPLGPGAVVDAHVGIAQQIVQDQRGLTGPGADGAVGDDAALRHYATVQKELPQPLRALEGALS